MKCIISAAALLLSSLASASPLPRDASAGPYDITDFSASKGHLSGYCSYNFDVAAPALSEPVHCTAYLDAGFSGATWLAYVYEGAGRCNNSAVSFTFFNDVNVDGVPKPATFNVTVDGVRGTYIVPATDITVRLNNEPNPFDNDVSYTGPRNFQITQFL